MTRRALTALLATLLASCGLLVGAESSSAATVLRQVSATELPGTSTPTDVAVSASGGFALALTRDGLQRLSLTTGKPVPTAFTSEIFGDRIVIKPAGNTAYVLLGDSRLLVIDLRDGGLRRASLLYRTDFVSSSAFDIALSGDGNFLYVKHGQSHGSWGSGSGIQVLSVSDPLNPRRLADVPRSEYYGELARAGQRLVTTVASGTGIRFYAIDGNTVRPGRFLVLPFAVRALTVGPSGNYAFAFSADDPLRVAKITMATGAVVTARVSVPDHARAAVVSPDGQFLYVTTAAGPGRRGLVVMSATELTLSSSSTGVHSPPSVAVASTGPAAGLVYVLDDVSDGHPHLVTFRPRTTGGV